MIETNNDSTEILGVKCNANLYLYNNNYINVFYSNKYKTEKEIYDKDDYGIFNYIYTTGALPLRMTIKFEYKGYNIIYTDIEIKEEQLPDCKFYIPKFIEMIKNPVL